MYTPFENLPEDSKIWIYQSNRKLTDDEVTEITKKCQEFVENWAAHGTSLEASFLLKYNSLKSLAQFCNPSSKCLYLIICTELDRFYFIL